MISIWRLLLIFAVLLCTSCSEKEPIFNSQSYVFGTLIDITIYGEPDAEASLIAAKVTKKLQQLHNQLHAWKPSKLNAINRQLAKGNTAYATDEIAVLVAKTQVLAAQSDGYFNPAIGHLVQTWGFHNDHFKPKKIDANTIKNLVAKQPNMSNLTITGRTIRTDNPSVKLDLGGIAKGYALDVGVHILRTQGIRNALLNIGGNVIAIGQRGNKPWRVGIQHPRQPNAIAAVDLPDGWAIGTSGDYQRYFMLDGQRYCHLIDPKTGYPAQGTQSVTAMIPPQEDAGLQSDFVTKPIFIAPASQKQAVADKLNLTHFMVIQADGDIIVSPDLEKKLEWLTPDAQTQLTK